MENTTTLTTMGNKHRTKTTKVKNTIQKVKTMNNTDLTKY